MNTVNTWPSTADRVRPHPTVGPTMRAMMVGQHVMATVLTTVGTLRAVGTGTPLAAAVVAGVMLWGWHTLGAGLTGKLAPTHRMVWWLMGLATVWVAAVAVSAEYVWFAFLLWLLAGHLLPGRWAVTFSLAVFSIVVIAPLLHDGAADYASIFGPLIGGVFALGISRGYLQLLREAAERERLVTSLTRARHEMAELQDELAVAQRQSGAIAERTRLSRDIHDTIAQALSSIRLIAHAGSDQSADATAAAVLQQIETLAGESLSDVRRIVAALVPAELEGKALSGALVRMLTRLDDETGLHTELAVDDTLPLLPTDIEVALLRTAQSVLANARLHAEASRVIVSLIDADDTVRLDIIDNGRGFDVSQWETRTEPASSGYGLRFVRSRLRELGGGLDIESSPGEGTAVSAYLPIHVAAGHKP